MDGIARLKGRLDLLSRKKKILFINSKRVKNTSLEGRPREGEGDPYFDCKFENKNSDGSASVCKT